MINNIINRIDAKLLLSRQEICELDIDIDEIISGLKNAVQSVFNACSCEVTTSDEREHFLAIIFRISIASSDTNKTLFYATKCANELVLKLLELDLHLWNLRLCGRMLNSNKFDASYAFIYSRRYYTDIITTTKFENSFLTEDELKELFDREINFCFDMDEQLFYPYMGSGPGVSDVSNVYNITNN